MVFVGVWASPHRGSLGFQRYLWHLSCVRVLASGSGAAGLQAAVLLGQWAPSWGLGLSPESGMGSPARFRLCL